MAEIETSNERPYWCPMPNHGHHDTENCPKCAVPRPQADEWITRDLAQWETSVNTSDLRDLLYRARAEINRYRGVETQRVPRCYEVDAHETSAHSLLASVLAAGAEPLPKSLRQEIADYLNSGQKASALPIDAQCSWGCRYDNYGRLDRNPACTVHGASGQNGKSQS